MVVVSELDPDVAYPATPTVPESGLHSLGRFVAYGALRAWFAGRADCWVGEDRNVYYRNGDPAVVVAPDVICSRTRVRSPRGPPLLFSMPSLSMNRLSDRPSRSVRDFVLVTSVQIHASAKRGMLPNGSFPSAPAVMYSRYGPLSRR